LYLKAVRSKRQSGQITVWLALGFLVFLTLYLACLQSIQKQSQRRWAEQATENGMFSLFSEYEPHLLEKYGLFYLDASFQSGTEKQDELCSHLWQFTDRNLTESLELQGVNVKNLVRATDAGGAVFYQQAIQVMKERSGADLLEDLVFTDSQMEEYEENSQKFQEDLETYRDSVENYEDEDDELEDEAYEWDGLTDSFTLSMAIPDTFTLSGKSVNLQSVPSHRTLSIGTGKATGNENGLIQKQWFLSYLDQYLTDAQEMLPEESTDSYLDYQREYVLFGNASDQKNLEQAIQRILLIREGVNYVFLLNHPEYSDKADTLAFLLAGLTGNEVLIDSVKHLILLGWAYGESLVEVRQLLYGSKLPVVKSSEDWQVPLSGLLTLLGNPGRYDQKSNREEGIGYDDFLRGFLTILPAETLAMRSLDVVEGELQKIDGCQKIHLDHCLEELTAQIWMDGIYLERTYGYE
jgi:hypothetical protein